MSTEYHRRKNGDFDWSEWKYTLEEVWLHRPLTFMGYDVMGVKVLYN